MNIQPRLVLIDMDMARMDVFGTKSYVRMKVELWQEVGLAVHQLEPMNGQYSEWRVSHYGSGRSVLKNMWDRREAIKWMMALRNILVDWRLSYEQFVGMQGRTLIVEQVLLLQNKIDGKELENEVKI